MPFAIAAGIGLVGTMVASDAASSSADKANQTQERIADGQTKLGQDQLAWNKQTYADGAGARAQAMQISGDAAKSQLAAQDQQTKIAADYDAYNKGTFRPLEQKIVSDAQGYDTAGRRADAVANATADVSQAYQGSEASMGRSLERSGVVPGSGRSQALMQDMAISKANSIAGATTGATRNVEAVGAARMADAANLGRSLPSSQATAAGLAITAGNSAGSNAAGVVNAQEAGVNQMNSGYAGAMTGGASAGNLYGQAASSYNKTADAMGQAMGGIGSAAGNYLGKNGVPDWISNLGKSSSAMETTPSIDQWITSDENCKTDTDTPIDTKKALKGIEDTPVKKGWMYDPSKGGPDDGGVPHDGPMAQDVAKRMGEDVAPGGKKIDIATMNGRLMAGMQEQSKRIKKLEKQRSAK